MKACYFLILFALSSHNAFSQTNFKRPKPFDELKNYYEQAGPATLADFPVEADGEGYLSCQEWREGGNEFIDFGSVTRVIKKTSDGGYRGSGPLFPDYAGVETATMGLALKTKVEDMNPQQITEGSTELTWNYGNHDRKPYSAFFRKRDKYLFFYDTNGTTVYYGYCWNEKNK